MNAEIKNRWTTALRSGRYRQGRGVLHSQSGAYCCLGVLCELAVNDGIIPSPQLHEMSHNYLYGNGASAYLPSAVSEWAGVDSTASLPVLVNHGDTGPYRELAGLNDAGASFEEISDIIEEHL